MKLVVVGATGLIGNQVIRQALSHPAITSDIALGRRPTATPVAPAPAAPPPSENGSPPPPPPSSSSSGRQSAPTPAPTTTKFQSVTCPDFANEYPAHVQDQLSDADACIWLLAVTPSKSKSMDRQNVRTICLDYALNGLRTLIRLRDPRRPPLRFVYASGAKAERDQTKKPWILGDYLLIRILIKLPNHCLVETHLLDATQASAGAVETCILRIGLVQSPPLLPSPSPSPSSSSSSSSPSSFLSSAFDMLVRLGAAVVGVPLIGVDEVAAAALRAAVRGFDADTLHNDDLVSMGRLKLRERR